MDTGTQPKIKLNFSESLRSSIPTVMRALAQARNTGVLHIRGCEADGELRFFRGEIVSARASTIQPLGNALAERGAITQTELTSVLALQRRKKQFQPMATILVSFGIVDEDVVATEIQRQVQAVLEDVLTWGAGEYSFEAKPVADDSKPNFTLPYSGSVDEILACIDIGSK